MQRLTSSFKSLFFPAISQEPNLKKSFSAVDASQTQPGCRSCDDQGGSRSPLLCTSPPEGPQHTVFCQRCCGGSARERWSSTCWEDLCSRSCTNLVLHKSSSTPKADTAMGCSETNLGQASTKAQSLLWQGPHTPCGHVLSLCEIPRDLTAVQILTRGPCKLATVTLEAQNHRESCPTR